MRFVLHKHEVILFNLGHLLMPPSSQLDEATYTEVEWCFLQLYKLTFFSAT